MILAVFNNSKQQNSYISHHDHHKESHNFAIFKHEQQQQRWSFCIRALSFVGQPLVQQRDRGTGKNNTTIALEARGKKLYERPIKAHQLNHYLSLCEWANYLNGHSIDRTKTTEKDC